MTPNRPMVLAHLREMKITVATEISRFLGIPLTAVYEDLVSLESEGLARVRITYHGDAVIAREWTAAHAMEAA